MTLIEIANVSKSFPTGQGPVEALRDIHMTIEPGEFVCIVGPSGCGKSTLLNMVAGFEQPTRGQILLQGKPITTVTSRCGMVFQQYALFPWKTMAENIEFGLKMQGLGRVERRERIREYLRLMGLEGFEDAYPDALSGGMKQRAAIARVLANDPEVLLMDEPFASLDAMTRQLLQEELLRIYDVSKKTILFITHSIDEALLLSTRVCVMSARPGRIMASLPNPLPFPRDASAQLSETYLRLKTSIWDSVQAEVQKTLRLKVSPS